MTPQETIEQMGTYLSEAYNKLEEKGATMPEQRNMANLAPTIRTLVKPYDPANPTLEGLKAAVDAEDYTAFPAGTEIPDTWDGNDNPLIVAQYLDSSNNSAYGGAEGVILVRKYVTGWQPFNSTNTGDYNTSSVLAYLQSTYYKNCSDEAKAVLSEFSVPYNSGTTTSSQSATSHWHLISCTEMLWYTTIAEGLAWDYYKQTTGLDTPNNLAEAGRIAYDSAGTATPYWTRTTVLPTAGTYVQSNGNITTYNLNMPWGVVACCFIGKES